MVALLAFLTKAISDNPLVSRDISVMNWIVGWGLTTFFEVVSFVTGAPRAEYNYGPVGIASLYFRGKFAEQWCSA